RRGRQRHRLPRRAPARAPGGRDPDAGSRRRAVSGCVPDRARLRFSDGRALARRRARGVAAAPCRAGLEPGVGLADPRRAAFGLVARGRGGDRGGNGREVALRCEAPDAGNGGDGMKFETLAVHASEPDGTTGDVAPPIHLATTFTRDAKLALTGEF